MNDPHPTQIAYSAGLRDGREIAKTQLEVEVKNLRKVCTILTNYLCGVLAPETMRDMLEDIKEID